jgi:tRNA pseudouridine32 synthase/23S rRNA pseudouridine746 synthase
VIVLRHVDDALVVVEKPAGLPAVPGRAPGLDDCVARRVAVELPDALVVHRLDQATSGLMLFARGAAMQQALSRAFADRAVAKRYVAIVAGRTDADAGEIDTPIAADWPNRPRRIVDRERGQPSLTRWRVLARDLATTRFELEPVTGRTHQLRVHLASIGHPILGDALYAPPEVQEAAPRLLLHASALRFVHPRHGTPIAIESAPPF